MFSGKTSRKIFLGLSLTAAIWHIPAYAADEPAPKHSRPTSAPTDSGGGASSLIGPMAYLDRFKSTVDGLKLDDAARKKADALFDAARKQLATLDSSDPAAVSTKAHEAFDKLRKDVGDLLTNEQKLEISKKLQGVATSVRIDQIKQRLYQPEFKLTDEQKQQVADVLDETKAKLEELRAAGAKDSRGKVQSILSEMKEKLTKILSPEQLKDFGGAGAKPDAGVKKTE